MFLGGRHGSDLALAISSLITDVRDECLVMVARLIETMLKVILLWFCVVAVLFKFRYLEIVVRS